MPGFQAVLAHLNVAFGKDRIRQLAAHSEAFAPGMPLAAGLVIEKGTPLHGIWVEYLSKLPGSFQEAFRATVYYALTTKPPTTITFAWAPGYDYELSMWQAPDTKLTKGGITILLKSRYPDDTHPIAPKASKRSK